MPERAATICESTSSRIGLAGDGVRGGEAHLGGDEFVEAADLRMVAAEKLEEAGLRAGRSFHTAGFEFHDSPLDFGEVHHQIVSPETGPLADGGRLRRLQMREPQAGQSAMLGGKRRQPIDDGR